MTRAATPKRKPLPTVQTSAPLVTRDPGDVERFEPAIPLDWIKPSKTNPRKTFDPDTLLELARSIGEKGVVQPILVRPLIALGKEPRYELVAGERRWRASKLAGATTIKAMVRELSSQDVVEIQTIENLQRDDVHPIEEADGYRTLIETYGYTADSLAAKIGKSSSYVYGVLKLLNLPEAALKAFGDGTLSQSTAQLIGRVPNEQLRKKAAAAICGWKILTFREAKDLIERDFMTELKGAPFNQNDASLTPAGACSTCPKKTGNARALYPDGRADICTDTSCFREKIAAHGARVEAKFRGEGKAVLADGDKLFSAYGVAGKHELRFDARFVDLAAKCYDAAPEEKDGEHDEAFDARIPTYAEVLGDAGKRLAVLAIDPAGQAHEVVPKAQAEAILIENKILAPSRVSVGRAEELKKQAEEKEVNDEVRRRLIQAASKNALGCINGAVFVSMPKFVRPLLAMAVRMLDWQPLSTIQDFHKIEGGDSGVAKLVDDLDGPRLLGLLAIAAVGELADDSTYAEDSPKLKKALFHALGLDETAVRKQVRKELHDKSKKKAKAKS